QDDFAHTRLSENATMVPGGFSRTREDRTMAPRAARRGVRVVVVLVLGVVVFVTLLVVAGVPLPQIRAGLCGPLGTVVPLDQVLPAGGGPALGRGDRAVQTLEGAYGPWRRHAGAGASAAATNFATCAPVSWANPARLWHMCVNGSRDAYDFSFETSRETVPRWVFRILLGEGR